MINFENKRVLIRPEQADTTKGKKVVTMNDLLSDRVKKNYDPLRKRKNMVWLPKANKLSDNRTKKTTVFVGTKKRVWVPKGSQSVKPSDVVQTLTVGVIQHSNTVRKNIKKVWVPKGSGQVKIDVRVQASIATTTKKTKPKRTIKKLLANYEHKKADEQGFDRTWRPRNQPLNQKFVCGFPNHWRPHHEFPQYTPSVYEPRDAFSDMFDYSPWFRDNPWMSYYGYRNNCCALSREHIYAWLSWLYQNTVRYNSFI